MKKYLIITIALLASFCIGFAFSRVMHRQESESIKPRVTGIGGIFFKCKDPAKVRDWYETHLSLHTNKFGAVFEWRQGADTTQKGFTQWSPFNEKTTYFLPSTKDFMINYRVVNLETLVNNLRNEGVTVVDTIKTYDYGKFVHILDIEGNKLELWEPNDIVYESMGREMGSTTTK